MAISKEQAYCDHDYGAPVKGWTKCIKCGLKTRASQIKKEKEIAMDVTTVDREGNNVVIHGAGETAETPDLVMPKVEKPEVVEVILSSGKISTGKTVVITCIDCGAERIIKIQDAFQVKRCVACQKKATNRKRYENRKKNKALKKAAEVPTENSIAVPAE